MRRSSRDSSSIVDSTPKEYNKPNCQLKEFPTIKLHILQNIEVLNLSDNYINDLRSLQIHSATSQHVLAQLKTVNLADNEIDTAEALLPLAQTAKHIKHINIGGNPLVNRLNFLYEIGVAFKEVEEIDCDMIVKIDGTVRSRMVEHQLNGGALISNFLEAIGQKTRRISEISNFKQEIDSIQDILTTMEGSYGSINEQNTLIMDCIQHFLNYWSPINSSRQQTFRSPQPNRRLPQQIEAISEYQITNSPNNLLRYLTQVDQPYKSASLVHFYYKQVITSKLIQRKLLEQIQIDEQQMDRIEGGDLSNFTHQQFFSGMSSKWKKDFKLTSIYQPASISHHSSQGNTLTPFKSIQTDITSRRDNNTELTRSRNTQNEHYYFGLDQQWTSATHQFLKQRFLSLIKSILEKHSVNGFSEEPSEYHSSSRNRTTDREEIFKYQTFGQLLPEVKPLQLDDYQHVNEQTIMSPKSRNRFIIGSSVRILQQVLKKIVLRRIASTKVIRPYEIVYLAESIRLAIRRWKEIAFRRITQQAFFYTCLKRKMEFFKLKSTFKAWKLIKRRKLKLLKVISNRKNKKQKAFLSVFLTHWRITSRHIKMEQFLKSKQQQFQSQKKPIDDLSCILKRSSTCQKLTGTGRHWPVRGGTSKQTLKMH